jgi:hypothetical protein
MALVTYILDIGIESTPEEQEEARAACCYVAAARDPSLSVLATYYHGLPSTKADIIIAFQHNRKKVDSG